MVRAAGLRDGLVSVFSRHTTLSVRVQENEALLLEDLKAFLTAQLKTRLDADVTAGRITSQQETDQLSQSCSRIYQFITNTRPPRGPSPTSPNPAPTSTATSG